MNGIRTLTEFMLAWFFVSIAGATLYGLYRYTVKRHGNDLTGGGTGFVDDPFTTPGHPPKAAPLHPKAAEHTYDFPGPPHKIYEDEWLQSVYEKAHEEWGGVHEVATGRPEHRRGPAGIGYVYEDGIRWKVLTNETNAHVPKGQAYLINEEALNCMIYDASEQWSWLETNDDYGVPKDLVIKQHYIRTDRPKPTAPKGPFTKLVDELWDEAQRAADEEIFVMPEDET